MHRPTAARGVLTRGALYLGALCILLGAATLGAEAAAADELAILVEGTRGADERVEVTLRASSPRENGCGWPS